MPQKKHNCGPSASPNLESLEAQFKVGQEQPSPPANTGIAAIRLESNQFTYFFQLIGNF